LGLLGASPAIWNGISIPIVFSFGVFELQNGEDADSTIARADAAMYEQKRLRFQAGKTVPANM
jgi:PleD family two-component response regulator